MLPQLISDNQDNNTRDLEMGCRKWFGFRKLERQNFSFNSNQEEQQNYLEKGSFRIIEYSFSIQKPNFERASPSEDSRLSEALHEIFKFEKTFNINLDD